MSAASVTSIGRGSSAVSQTTKTRIRTYYRSKCLVCGYPVEDVLEVAHIFAKTDRTDSQVRAFKEWSPEQLRHFNKNNPENLLLLCPNHHQEHGIPDPGQRLPFEELKDKGFEYVPLTVPYYLEIHNSTTDRPAPFLFDSPGGLPLSDSPVEVPLYPLLAMSYQILNNFTRYDIPCVNIARDEVTRLVNLYRWKLIAPPVNTTRIMRALSVQSQLDNHLANYPPGTQPGHNTSTSLPSIPEASQPGTGMVDHGGAMVDNLAGGPSSSLLMPSDRCGGLTMDGPVVVDASDDDEDDPPVTPAILLSRLRWHWQPVKLDHPDLGSMRFATSSDFVTPSGQLA
ncbi:hypothetical protein M407DRAFT_31750 [Tulasnella calospora MUT 4182]|uniref:HNH nuclease domain-containing protein n=1 Tax=Tulasnella calospora MUT 4182 TaxID=1051891 RepID=A0A0C3Q5Z4_9AGAM|nr:hypothetical protein M407DRAFT_31750 [Tulasnella calospora MUT 4182]